MDNFCGGKGNISLGIQNFAFPEWDSPLAERICALFNRLPDRDTRLDDRYFLRAGDCKSNPDFSDRNPKFTRAKGHWVAEIHANEWLTKFILQLLEVWSDLPATLKLRWTASKVSVVELIYALYAGAVYNNGLAEIREIAETFGRLFQMDPGNYYNVFNEIRLAT